MSRSSAAPSTARLPTLQPVVEKVANTEDGPLVKGHVSGVQVTFLVDTGANVTIVKPSLLNRINAPERPPLERVETSMLLADGSSLPFLGRGHFHICLGEEEVFHDVWVAEIELDGIIGMDFIKKHNCWLTLGQGPYELLESRFGSKHQTEMYRAQLRCRTRKRDETLPQLAQAISLPAKLIQTPHRPYKIPWRGTIL